MTIQHQMLVDLIRDSGHTIETGLNALQEAGVISDNCVFVEDICDSDAMRAIEWFRAPGNQLFAWDVRAESDRREIEWANKQKR